MLGRLDRRNQAAADRHNAAFNEQRQITDSTSRTATSPDGRVFTVVARPKDEPLDGPRLRDFVHYRVALPLPLWPIAVGAMAVSAALAVARRNNAAPEVEPEWHVGVIAPAGNWRSAKIISVADCDSLDHALRRLDEFVVAIERGDVPN